MNARFPTHRTLLRTPSQGRLEKLIVDRLQVRNGCTPELAEQLISAHHMLLFGYERKGILSYWDIEGLWGRMQRNGPSRQVCRPEPLYENKSFE